MATASDRAQPQSLESPEASTKLSLNRAAIARTVAVGYVGTIAAAEPVSLAIALSQAAAISRQLRQPTGL